MISAVIVPGEARNCEDFETKQALRIFKSDVVILVEKRGVEASIEKCESSLTDGGQTLLDLQVKTEHFRCNIMLTFNVYGKSMVLTNTFFINKQITKNCVPLESEHKAEEKTEQPQFRPELLPFKISLDQDADAYKLSQDRETPRFYQPADYQTEFPELGAPLKEQKGSSQPEKRDVSFDLAGQFEGEEETEEVVDSDSTSKKAIKGMADLLRLHDMEEQKKAQKAQPSEHHESEVDSLGEATKLKEQRQKEDDESFGAISNDEDALEAYHQLIYLQELEEAQKGARGAQPTEQAKELGAQHHDIDEDESSKIVELTSSDLPSALFQRLSDERDIQRKANGRKKIPAGHSGLVGAPEECNAQEIQTILENLLVYMHLSANAFTVNHVKKCTIQIVDGTLVDFVFGSDDDNLCEFELHDSFSTGKKTVEAIKDDCRKSVKSEEPTQEERQQLEGGWAPCTGEWKEEGLKLFADYLQMEPRPPVSAVENCFYQIVEGTNYRFNLKISKDTEYVVNMYAPLSGKLKVVYELRDPRVKSKRPELSSLKKKPFVGTPAEAPVITYIQAEKAPEMIPPESQEKEVTASSYSYSDKIKCNTKYMLEAFREAKYELNFGEDELTKDHIRSCSHRVSNGLIVILSFGHDENKLCSAEVKFPTHSSKKIVEITSRDCKTNKSTQTGNEEHSNHIKVDDEEYPLPELRRHETLFENPYEVDRKSGEGLIGENVPIFGKPSKPQICSDENLLRALEVFKTRAPEGELRFLYEENVEDCTEQFADGIRVVLNLSVNEKKCSFKVFFAPDGTIPPTEEIHC